MRTPKWFGSGLALFALTMAVFMSCAAEGEDDTPPAKQGGGGNDYEGVVPVLTPSVGTLSPAFDEATKNGYEIEVPYGTQALSFTYGEDEVDSGDVSGSIADDVNTFVVKLEIAGIEQEYTINVIRMPNADISSITLSASDFTGSPIVVNNPGSSVSQTAPYNSNNTPPDISVTLVLADGSAVTSYGGDFNAWIGGATSGTVAVAKGETKNGTITITNTKNIASATRVTARNYTLAITRPSYTPLATGGQVEFIENDDGSIDEVHVFTDSGALTFSGGAPNIPSASLLVVAGGGGGGAGCGENKRRGGGGGAGGLVYYDKAWTLNELSYEVVVGAGGTKAVVAGSSVADASNGGDSSFGDDVLAKGGGKGTSHNFYRAGNGGSGGGGTKNFNNGGTAQEATLPDGDDPAVYSFGGNGGFTNQNYSACGGGGAGGAGANVGGTQAGSKGGNGKKIDIEKSGAKWYAAGGNAGGVVTPDGDGSASPNPNGATDDLDAEAGAAGTGNGGGGGYAAKAPNYAARATAADGGSGVVIIRFHHSGT